MNKMKHTKKMQLVELGCLKTQDGCASSSFNNMRDENYSDPHTLQNMDNEMNLILNDSSVSPDQKWHLYNQALQRYLGFIKRLRSVGGPLNHSMAEDDYDIHESLSKSHTSLNHSMAEDEYDIHESFSKKRPSIPRLNITPTVKNVVKRKQTVLARRITRKNSRPSDIVSPLKAVKRTRRTIYKAKGVKGDRAIDNRKASSRRRESVVDARRNISDGYSDDAYDDADDGGDDIIKLKPCSVVLKKWVNSDIQK